MHFLIKLANKKKIYLLKLILKLRKNKMMTIIADKVKKDRKNQKEIHKKKKKNNHKKKKNLAQ